MNTQILAISGTSIRQDEQGRFCLNDLHIASGNESKHKPANFLRNQQAIDLIELLKSEKLEPVNVINGIGTLAVKELVYAYAMWISAKFHLAVIRAYDALVTTPQNALKALPTAMPKIITPAMQRQVQKRISELVKTQVGTSYQMLYGQIKDKFNVGTYKDLPYHSYHELCEFLDMPPLEGEWIPCQKNRLLPEIKHEHDVRKYLVHQTFDDLIIIDVNNTEEIAKELRFNGFHVFNSNTTSVNQLILDAIPARFLPNVIKTATMRLEAINRNTYQLNQVT